MARVIVHATVTLDGFLADADGGVGWMFGRPSAPEDDVVVENVMKNIGAIVGGANKTQTIDDGEIPYGGMLKVPVYPHDPQRARADRTRRHHVHLRGRRHRAGGRVRHTGGRATSGSACSAGASRDSASSSNSSTNST